MVIRVKGLDYDVKIKYYDADFRLTTQLNKPFIKLFKF